MIIDNFFQFFGQAFLLLVFGFFSLMIIALILGKILIKKDVLIFPKLIVFSLDVFYSPLKRLARSLGFDETMVDHVGVEVRNKLNEKKFRQIDNKAKILVLPHCLRNPKCEANLDETGLNCNCCGKCSVGVIKPKAESIGYKVFIIPGSTFIKKIIKDNKFEAVMGVACYEDLNLAMMKLSGFNPQGVLLSRTGCFKTKVDVKTVLEKIGYETKKDFELNNSLSNDIDLCVDEKTKKV